MPDYDTSGGAENELPANALTDTNTKTVTNKSISGSTNILTSIPDSALNQITDKTKLQNNIFYKDDNNDLGIHYIDIEQIAEPATPPAGKSRIYKDAFDGQMKAKNYTGGVASFQNGGAAALTGLSDVAIASQTDQQYIRWDAASSKWMNKTAFPAGEANTITNIGTSGLGIFKQKTLADLELYKINSLSAKLTIALDSPNNKIDFDIASSVTTDNNTQSFSGKTLSINTNTINHSTTNIIGDILKNNGTSYQRLAKGTANQVLKVNPAGTDLEWGSAGSGDVSTTASNTYGDFDQVFRSGRLDIRNPTNSFSYNVVGSAIINDRNIILPLLAGNDTIVCEAHTQTLTNKTLTTPIISSISNSGTITLPTGTDTLVGKATTDTLTSKTINATNNTITDTSIATGDIMVASSGKFVRKARGTSLQVLRTNSAGTDIEYASLDSERVGKATAASGSTVYNIAHGLGSNPTYAFINCSSHTTTFTYTTDATNIVVTFSSTISSGTVTIYWRVVA